MVNRTNCPADDLDLPAHGYTAVRLLRRVPRYSPNIRRSKNAAPPFDVRALTPDEFVLHSYPSKILPCTPHYTSAEYSGTSEHGRSPHALPTTRYLSAYTNPAGCHLWPLAASHKSLSSGISER